MIPEYRQIFRQMLYDTGYLLAMSDDPKQVFVTNEVESRVRSMFSLEILSESFLDLVGQVSSTFQTRLGTQDVHGIYDKG